jgi:uncharacterized protein DUF3592
MQLMILLSFKLEIPVTLLWLAPAVLLSLGVYLFRWGRRWSIANRAVSWPSADATVNSSFELDENESALAAHHWQGEGETDIEYAPLWSTAIQYTYRMNGEIYAGTYFLPATSPDGHIAAESGRSWIGKKIAVRYNPPRPDESAFLVQDGAPGKPHIPRTVSDRPHFTKLSLK